MARYTVYEITLNETWSDQTSSGMRVIRFKTAQPLIVAMRQDQDFLFGLFSEYEPSANKGLGRWGLFKEGACALHQIIKIMEIENVER